jgi:predicted ester cyclase
LWADRYKFPAQQQALSLYAILKLMSPKSKYLSIAVASLLAFSCSHPSSQVTLNKKLASRYIYEVVNDKNLNLIDDIFSQDYIAHSADSKDSHIIQDGSLKNFLIYFFKAFPNIHYTIDNIISEGDIVALNLTAAGAQKGEFIGYQASQKTIRYKEMFFFRVSNNKLIEGWGLTDIDGIREQLTKQ